MGTYYKIENLDKEEIIELSQYTNIKAGAYEKWSYQIAILTMMLGGSTRATNIDLPQYWNRWAGDRIRIENDNNYYNPDSSNWKDVGEEFFKYLNKIGMLKEWLERSGFNTESFNFELLVKELEKCP